jgi:hypothetical protein
MNSHESLPVVHLEPDYYAIQQKYLSQLPPGPTVEGGKATQIRDFFGTPMGSTILRYFDSLTVQADGSRGMNRYKLSDENYRFWLAIKILAGSDNAMYARSLAADRNLFVEFVQKTQK